MFSNERIIVVYNERININLSETTGCPKTGGMKVLNSIRRERRDTPKGMKTHSGMYGYELRSQVNRGL